MKILIRQSSLLSISYQGGSKDVIISETHLFERTPDDHGEVERATTGFYGLNYSYRHLNLFNDYLRLED